MPIFIQALPLSLFTFWGYLILMPFLAIGVLLLSLFSVIPILGWFVPGMVGVWMTIMGFRCALAARGHVRSIDTATLFNVCFFFSVIFLGVSFVVKAMMWAVVWGMQKTGFALDPLGLFAGLFGVSPYWSTILLAYLAPLALTNAAFAVPLTAAAASTGASGWNYGAFAGFGRGVIGLSVVMAVWLFSGHMFSFFGEIWTSFGLIVGMLWALAEGESLPFQTDLAPWTALRGTLIMAWASSWYFATSVLTWERYVKQPSAQHREHATADPSSLEDIRALRRARMPKRG